MPIISFILPVYNVERYLVRCLDSIYALHLNIEQFEVLCIDDCSTDMSVSIIQKYQMMYPNLYLLQHKHNSRQGATRNTGIYHAKGRYCMFVDSDDSLPTFDIYELLRYMQNNNLELLLGKANVVCSNGSISNWGNPPAQASSIMRGPEIFIDEKIHKIAFGVVWLAIYDINLVRRIPPFYENIQYEDTDWTLRCAYEASLLQYIPIVFYNYHVNPATTTTTKSIRSLVERTKQSLRLYSWALTTVELHSEVIRAIEDYAVWNVRCLTGLIKYNYRERNFFYQSFSSQELRTISCWKGNNYTRIYTRFPNFSQVLFLFLHPCYKLYIFTKRLIISKFTKH